VSFCGVFIGAHPEDLEHCSFIVRLGTLDSPSNCCSTIVPANISSGDADDIRRIQVGNLAHSNASFEYHDRTLDIPHGTFYRRCTRIWIYVPVPVTLVDFSVVVLSIISPHACCQRSRNAPYHCIPGVNAKRPLESGECRGTWCRPQSALLRCLSYTLALLVICWYAMGPHRDRPDVVGLPAGTADWSGRHEYCQRGEQHQAPGTLTRYGILTRCA